MIPELDCALYYGYRKDGEWRRISTRNLKLEEMPLSILPANDSAGESSERKAEMW